MKKNIKIVIILILVFVLLGGIIGYHFLYYRNNHLDPISHATYYEIFDKNAILDGTEDNANVVDQKLDKRLKKYQHTFEKMAGTNDGQTLKALFYMNFVHMAGIYGKRELKKNTLKDLLWGGQYQHCGTNTLFLAMLLDKAGYEFRTVSVGNGSHGFVEIKLDNSWHILDPTVNIWINKNTEELLSESDRVNKQFFLKATDQYNQKAYEGIVRVINVQDMMLKLGPGYKPKIDQYNYINLSDYKY